jgi:hypothetical protein
VGLTIASLVNLKGALVRSDETHIFQAIGPFLFLFLVSMYFMQGQRLLSYMGFILLGLMAAHSLRYASIVTGQLKQPILAGANLARQWQALHESEVDRRSIVPEALEQAIDPRKQILNFPYNNVMAIALGRPSLAPILQTYAAFNEDLQQLYVRELALNRDSTEIIYGPDGLVSYQVSDVQSITRTPIIFKYMFENYTLKTDQAFAGGYVVLTPRPHARSAVATSLAYTTRASGGDITLALDRPAACGLLEFDASIHYPATAVLGRPNPVVLRFYHGDQLLAQGNLVAIERGRPFSTFFYIGPPEHFSQLFADQASADANTVFDRMEISPEPHDIFGVAPDSVTIGNLRCVQPPLAH